MKNKKYGKEKLMNENINNILTEMARVGHFCDNKYEIYIRTDDSGNLPHMHIWDSDTRGEKFHTCVRLDKAEYFHHTGKEDVLNNKMKKDLMKFLNTFNNKWNMTNWQRLLMEWNDNNSNIILPEDYEMPDYINI